MRARDAQHDTASIPSARGMNMTSKNLQGSIVLSSSTFLFVFGLVRYSSAQELETRVAPMPTESTLRCNGSHSVPVPKHWQYQPIWETVIATKPDLFLFLGDAIYADNDGKTAWSVTEQQLQGEWNRLADKPEFQAVPCPRFPIMATWDNHDYGTHNGGAEFELKEVSKRIFLNFFGEPQQSDAPATSWHRRYKSIWT